MARRKSDINIKFSADMRQFSSEMQNAMRQIQKHGQALQNVGRAMSTYITAPLALLGGLAIKSAADIEKLKVSLSTALGGTQAQTEKAFKAIEAFASKTPFALEEVAMAFIKLKNMGLDPSMDALKSYGNTASAMGKSLNDMIEAVADAAVGEFERLKEFGIKASSQGDNVAFTFKGVTTTVRKNAEEIETYLQNIGNVDFAGGIEKQSETLTGMLSTLKDNVGLVMAEFGNVMLPVVKRLTTVMTKVATVMRSISPEAKKVIVVIAAIAAALGPLIFGVGVMLSLVPAIVSGFTAISASAATVAIPIISVIAAIAAIGAAFIYVRDNADAFAVVFKNMWISLKNDVLKNIVAILKGINVLARGRFSGLIKELEGLKQPLDKTKVEFSTFGEAVKSTIKEVLGYKDQVEEAIEPTETIAEKTKAAGKGFRELNENVTVASKGIKGFVEENKLGLAGLRKEIMATAPAFKTIDIAVQQTGIEIGNVVQNAKDMMTSLNEGLRMLTADAFAALGTAIGELATIGGGQAMQNFGQNVLGAISQFMEQLGKQAIAIGVAAIGVDLALKSLNGPAAIAAGIALIAAAQLFKSTASKGLPSGGGGGGYSGGGGGSSMAAPRIEPVVLDVRIKGSDIALTQTRYNTFVGRTR